MAKKSGSSGKPKKSAKKRAKSPINYDEIPEWTDDDFARALLHPAGPTKQPVSLRLNTAVLKWFKDQGPGYQGRINKVLEHFVRKHQWTRAL